MSPANVPVPEATAARAPALGSGLQLGSWLKGGRDTPVTCGYSPGLQSSLRHSSPRVTLAKSPLSVCSCVLATTRLEGRPDQPSWEQSPHSLLGGIMVSEHALLSTYTGRFPEVDSLLRQQWMSLGHFGKPCIIRYKWTFQLAMKIVSDHPPALPAISVGACRWPERTRLGA